MLLWDQVLLRWDGATKHLGFCSFQDKIHNFRYELHSVTVDYQYLVPQQSLVHNIVLFISVHAKWTDKCGNNTAITTII